MSKQNNLTDFLTDVADAIREKKGTTEKINPQDFSEEIRRIGITDDEDSEVWETIEEVSFVDGAFSEYTNNFNSHVGRLTYTRTNVSAKWNPIYLPFEVPVSILAEQGFDVAYINGVRQEDNDFDGELDTSFTTDVVYIHCHERIVNDKTINVDGKSKTLKANYPYFIRSSEGSRNLEIVLANTVLYAAKDKSYDCTTMTESFKITGNSSNVVVKYSDDNRAYAVAGGEWKYSTSGATLKPFRFYMTVTSRDGRNPILKLGGTDNEQM